MSIDRIIIKAQKIGLTQQDIADITKTSQPTIARLLSGTGSDKSAVIVSKRLKQYLHCVEFDGIEFLLKV